jgi:AP-4 complex subunit sigma-1
MPIRFVLMVNKQGQTRLAQYYETMTIREKNTLESEMIRKCLARGEDQVSCSSITAASPPSHTCRNTAEL